MKWWWMRRPRARTLPHYGYREDEVPEYGVCRCGQVVRTDRLDLLAEHREVCAVRPS